MKVCAYTRCPRCLANVGVRGDGRMVVHEADDLRCRGSNRSHDEVIDAMSPETREMRGLSAIMRAFEEASDG